VSCMLCGADDARFLFEKSGRRLLRCRRCGLEWVDPMPSPAEIAAYYERSYAGGSYAFFSEAQQVRRLIAASRLDAIDGAVRPGRWLDVGASTGDFVEIAAERGRDVEGLELSDQAVAVARARGLRMHRSTVEAFDPDGRYAMISAFGVLEHVREPRTFLRRLRSWLEPGGGLVLTLPDVSSIYPRLLMGRHWFYYIPDEHLFYYSPATLRRLLEEEGFRVARVRRAWKRLTLRYASENLRHFLPGLGRVASAVVGRLPDSVTARGLPMYLGEMMVEASPRS